MAIAKSGGLLVVCFALLGCGEENGGQQPQVHLAKETGKPVLTSTDPDRPDVKDWHDRYDMPWAIEPGKIPFADERLRAVIVQADKVAREMADESWVQRAGEKYRYSSWNSGSSGYSREYLGEWKRTAVPKDGATPVGPHKIGISATLFNEPRSATSLQLSATRRGDDQWFVSVGLSASQFGSWLDLQFEHSEFLPASRSLVNYGSRYRWGPGQPSFSATQKDSSHQYRFHVSIQRRNAQGGIEAPSLEDKLAFLASAESFRDAAGAELDRLEERIRDYFASPTAGEVWTLGGPTGATPPMQEPRFEVPEAIRNQVREEALKELAHRRQVLNDHYQEMYGALDTAFPKLAEIISAGSEAKADE